MLFSTSATSQVSGLIEALSRAKVGQFHDVALSSCLPAFIVSAKEAHARVRALQVPGLRTDAPPQKLLANKPTTCHRKVPQSSYAIPVLQ